MKLGNTLVLAAGLFVAQAASAGQLLVNGGFETGNLNGWTITNQAGGSGNWFVSSAAATPMHAFATPGAHSGSYYAVTDQSGPGAHVLSQGFNVSAGAQSVVLNFSMFHRTWSAYANTNNGAITFTNGVAHFGRVDLLTGAASATDTGAGVLANFFLGTDGSTRNNPYKDYAFDITSLVKSGGAFQIRFAEVDNQGNYNMGIDDVSITERVPEPATVGLLGLGLAGIAAVRRRRQA